MNKEEIKAKLREEVRPHPSRDELAVQLSAVFGYENWEYLEGGATCQGVDFWVIEVHGLNPFRIDYKVDHEGTPLGGIVNDWHEVRPVAAKVYVPVDPHTYYQEQDESREL